MHRPVRLLIRIQRRSCEQDQLTKFDAFSSVITKGMIVIGEGCSHFTLVVTSTRTQDSSNLRTISLWLDSSLGTQTTRHMFIRLHTQRYISLVGGGARCSWMKQLDEAKARGTRPMGYYRSHNVDRMTGEAKNSNNSAWWRASESLNQPNPHLQVHPTDSLFYHGMLRYFL